MSLQCCSDCSYYTDTYFSAATIEFLGGWMSGGGPVIQTVSDTVAAEVKAFMDETFIMNDQPVWLYRVLTEPTVRETYDSLSSWTYELEMARNFAAIGDGTTHNPIVKTRLIRSTVFLDTTLLDECFIEHQCGGFPDEAEVLLQPGTYAVELVH
jgi:hypothetical protein